MLQVINVGLEEGETYLVREYSFLRRGIEFTLGFDVLDGSLVGVFMPIQIGFPFDYVMRRYCAKRNRVLCHVAKSSC